MVHGHGVGASIAQVEAGTFDDVDGLVLMSCADTGHTRLAVDGASRSYIASESVRTHVVRGAGSALPLEASAATTRVRVERWLRATQG